MEKRAELTSKTIVVLVILIISFVIILLAVYFGLDWTGRVDREVCHQSVIYRATLPAFGGLKDYVPLKCKTQKICITTGLIGGRCEEEFGESGGVTKIKVKDVQQINRAIAQEIIDCWSTMGEGKVSIFSQWLAEDYGIDNVYPSCVICSRIAFDKESLGEKGINLEDVDVMDYMMRYKIADRDITYYDYLIGEGGKISVGDLFEETTEDEAKQTIEEIKEQGEEKIGDFQLGDFELREIENPIELNKQGDELAVIFMQISSPGHGEVFIDTLKAGAAFLGLGLAYKPGAFVATQTVKMPVMRNALGQYITGSGKIVSKKTITPFAKFVIAAAIIGLGVQQGNIALNRAVTAGYCGDVSYGSEAKEGCSVVRTINYNKDEILHYCSVIESID